MPVEIIKIDEKIFKAILQGEHKGTLEAKLCEALLKQERDVFRGGRRYKVSIQHAYSTEKTAYTVKIPYDVVRLKSEAQASDDSQKTYATLAVDSLVEGGSAYLFDAETFFDFDKDGFKPCSQTFPVLIVKKELQGNSEIPELDHEHTCFEKSNQGKVLFPPVYRLKRIPVKKNKLEDYDPVMDSLRNSFNIPFSNFESSTSEEDINIKEKASNKKQIQTEEKLDGYFVMENIQGKTVDNILSEVKTKTKYFDLCDRLDLVTQLLALWDKHILKNKLIHRDLKPENMIYANGKIYFIDFGHSIDTDKPLATEYEPSTIPYCDPYAYEQKQYGHHLDLYALTMIIGELLGAERPIQTLVAADSSGKDVSHVKAQLQVFKDYAFPGLVDALTKHGLLREKAEEILSFLKSAQQAEFMKRPQIEDFICFFEAVQIKMLDIKKLMSVLTTALKEIPPRSTSHKGTPASFDEGSHLLNSSVPPDSPHMVRTPKQLERADSFSTYSKQQTLAAKTAQGKGSLITDSIKRTERAHSFSVFPSFYSKQTLAVKTEQAEQANHVLIAYSSV